MCRAAVRVLVVEEALAMLERDGPMSLPDPPLHARTTKVRRFLNGLRMPTQHRAPPRISRPEIPAVLTAALA